jgi:hypothetical protein
MEVLTATAGSGLFDQIKGFASVPFEGFSKELNPFGISALEDLLRLPDVNYVGGWRETG